MNKSKIVTELENMVVARLFGRQPWLADRETCCAVNRKLKQMGLWEVVCGEPETWRFSPLGKELDVLLFLVFMGFINAWDVPIILVHYRLIDELESGVIYARMDNGDAESILIGYVKRAYFDYRKATKFLR